MEEVKERTWSEYFKSFKPDWITWPEWKNFNNWTNIAIGGYTSLLALLTARGYTPMQIAKMHALFVAGALDLVTILSGNTPCIGPSDVECKTLSARLLESFGKKRRRTPSKKVRKSGKKGRKSNKKGRKL
jgi:hypothetical protein